MTILKLRKGSGIPEASDLAQGEPALDLTDKRLYTKDSGGNIVEVGTNPGVDVTFADNRKAVFGDGSDLQIYHDGSNSYISDQGTGTLKIQGESQVRLESTAGERYVVGNNNGGTRLYYDDVEKLATSATGIDITGTVTADDVTINGAITVTSTVDGRDVAADGTKLDGIEALADVTDTANVTAAGALMSTGGTSSGLITFGSAIVEKKDSVSGTNISIDTTNANTFTHTLTANTTYTFANSSTSGFVTSFTLKVTQDSTARTITWPSSVDWAGGEAPTLSTGSGDVDVFVFFTHDGGTTYYGFTAGQGMS